MDDAIRRLQGEARRHAHGKPPTGVRYPAAFRAAVVALVRTELGRGVAFGRLASTLGLARWSLARWLRQRPPAVLRPVTVASDSGTALRPPGPVLITPQGLRVEGLDRETLIAVLRALA